MSLAQYSVNNDINFLLSECNRYKQPYFTFNAYDTQILHRHFMPDSVENGLGKNLDMSVGDFHNVFRTGAIAAERQKIIKLGYLLTVYSAFSSYVMTKTDFMD